MNLIWILNSLILREKVKMAGCFFKPNCHLRVLEMAGSLLPSIIAMGWVNPILTVHLFAALKLSAWQPSATITVTSLDVKNCKLVIFQPSWPFESIKAFCI